MASNVEYLRYFISWFFYFFVKENLVEEDKNIDDMMTRFKEQLKNARESMNDYYQKEQVPANKLYNWLEEKPEATTKSVIHRSLVPEYRYRENFINSLHQDITPANRVNFRHRGDVPQVKIFILKIIIRKLLLYKYVVV